MKVNIVSDINALTIYIKSDEDPSQNPYRLHVLYSKQNEKK